MDEPQQPTGGSAEESAQVFTDIEKAQEAAKFAAMAWAGVTLYLQRVRFALRDVIERAEVHAASKGKHNERVLVFSDRLSVLANLLQGGPAGHPEALEWWEKREAALEALNEIHRIACLVEGKFGVPDEAASHTPIQKIEGMMLGLLGVVEQQKTAIEQQKTQINNLQVQVRRAHLR